MAHRTDRRTSLILVLCVAAWCGCAESDAPSGMAPAASAGSPGDAGAPGASGAAVSAAGAPAAGGAQAGGTSGSGRGGAPGASAGAASPSGGATGAGAALALVYVGSSNGQISIYKLDPALGQLSLLKSLDAGNYPSFIAFDPTFAHLYAVNEPDGKVAAFEVDRKNGDLTLLNRVDSGGGAPAFVSVERTGKFVMVANYDAGTTRVFPIAADGGLGAATDSKSPGMNPHMILTDPAGKFAFVVNKGSDTISQYVFDATAGKLTPNSLPSVTVPVGAGPRHLAFHPSGKYAYLIAEADDTMTAYSYDATLGQLTATQAPLSTLPMGADGASNTCAEVVVAPSGKFVYGSNRGHDSIATFAVEEATGKLTFVGTTPSGGMVPRSFALSGDGSLMLVANESGNVTTFSVDVASGSLAKLKSLEVPQKAQFVGTINLPISAE